MITSPRSAPQSRFFPGLWIALLVVLLLGGRYLWLRLDHPAHLHEIAAAYGSVGLFYAAPQSDAAGKRVTFVETSDHGYGVFLADTATGKKTLVVEESGSGDSHDRYDLRVWPWAPDDSAFVFSAAGQVNVCDPQTGRLTATVKTPDYVTGLTWLTPTAFVCVEVNGVIYRFEKQPDGSWSKNDIANVVDHGFALRSVDGLGSASLPDNSAEVRAWDAGQNIAWSAGSKTPVWLQYQFTGSAWAVTQYRLTSSTNDPALDPRDWQLLGSNDGATWTVLDVRSNEIFAARSRSNPYVFANNLPFQFYRLNITAAAGAAAGGVQLAQFQLWSEDSVPVASASSESAPNEIAAAAFDGLPNTKWYSDSRMPSGWLQYQFGGGAAWPISEYTLTSANDVPDRDPRDWQLEASNDGDNWIVLDRRANEFFNGRLQSRTYRFANSTPYRFYRLDITASRGNGYESLQLAEFDLGLKKLLARISDPDGGLALRSSVSNVIASASTPQPASLNKNTGGWTLSAANGSAWLQYEFPDSAWAITQYKLVSATNDPAGDPRDWQLLGSPDGRQWTVLDTRAAQTFPGRAQARRYAFPNLTPYRFYRLTLAAPADGAKSPIHVGQFQLWSENTPDSASASSESSSDESAAKAFDGDSNTKWYNGGAAAPAWLQYELGGGEAQVVSKYSLTSGNDVPERDPQAWTFQASNDGDNWVNLDTRAGETFSDRLQTKDYSFANSTPYRFYRLNITGQNGNNLSGLQLSEINFGRIAPAAPAGPSTPADIDLKDVGPGASPISGASCLTTLSGGRIAWMQNNRLWSMNVASHRAHLLLDVQNAAPPGTILRAFSYSPANGRFLLDCSRAGQDSLWRLDNDDSSSEMVEVPASAGVSNAVWAGASPDGWVGRLGNFLQVEPDSHADPVRILPRASIDSFQVSGDGRQIFVVGTTKNEASAGLWHYDLASAQLSCVVPCSDFPSPYAVQQIHATDSVRLPSGETLGYDIFPPAHLFHHPHAKYPLVLGDTYFGNVVNGAHGRLWIPALSACDCYVVVVNRRNWGDGIDRWGEDVMAVYQQLMANPNIDKSQVYLFGVSAETQYLSQFVERMPAPWRGIIFLNPTGLPNFSGTPMFQHRPKIFISAGGDEWDLPRFPRFQSESLKSGVVVEYFISPGEGHHFVGNAAQLLRTTAMAHFIFEE
jgi:hypothetical protein